MCRRIGGTFSLDGKSVGLRPAGLKDTCHWQFFRCYVYCEALVSGDAE